MKRIQELRTERGWSRYELARRLDVTPGTVYNWEIGRSIPDALKLRVMAQLFDVTMESIALVGIDVDREGDPLEEADEGELMLAAAMAD